MNTRTHRHARTLFLYLDQLGFDQFYKKKKFFVIVCLLVNVVIITQNNVC